MGLAWTSMGGSTLYVECTNVNGGPRLADGQETELAVGRVRSTGQLGDVMTESLSIAHSFSTRFLNQRAPDNVTLQSNDLQLHVPEGATPKDGPSAGELRLRTTLAVGCLSGWCGLSCCPHSSNIADLHAGM
jgi:ATP-dependent Lon protease